MKPDVRIIAAFYTSATALDESGLAHLCRTQPCAPYKHPRAYIRIDQMPTGTNGKLLRCRLPQFWPQNNESPMT